MPEKCYVHMYSSCWYFLIPSASAKHRKSHSSLPTVSVLAWSFFSQTLYSCRVELCLNSINYDFISCFNFLIQVLPLTPNYAIILKLPNIPWRVKILLSLDLFPPKLLSVRTIVWLALSGSCTSGSDYPLWVEMCIVPSKFSASSDGIKSKPRIRPFHSVWVEGWSSLGQQKTILEWN